MKYDNKLEGQPESTNLRQIVFSDVQICKRNHLYVCIYFQNYKNMLKNVCA